MAKWTAFPHGADTYRYDTATLKKHWKRLHAGVAYPEGWNSGVGS